MILLWFRDFWDARRGWTGVALVAFATTVTACVPTALFVTGSSATGPAQLALFSLGGTVSALWVLAAVVVTVASMADDLRRRSLWVKWTSPPSM